MRVNADMGRREWDMEKIACLSAQDVCDAHFIIIDYRS
jgi:hypothetical protein